MIDLHAIYYRNIWPFEWKECSLFFPKGKFLIKAPIGSGKSFLFFDGPNYALYKRATRNMLNVHCKEGEISLIFSEGENYYLVKRLLKKGKVRDWCESLLFSISPEGAKQLSIGQSTMTTESILQRWRNIIRELFEKNNILTEIPVKNESEIQSTIEQLLPPEEVFLSTMFLLQDADNIFEMQPSERLLVLKNVFWLLWIDDAKDEINEKKKEVWNQLKILKDHSDQDTKLRKLLKNWSILINEIWLENWKKRFDELELIGIDKLSIDDFNLNWLDIQLFLSHFEKEKEKGKEIVALKTKYELLTKQSNEKLDDLRKNEIEEKNLTQNIENIETRIKSIDVAKIDGLKQEKSKLYEEIQKLWPVEEKIQEIKKLKETWSELRIQQEKVQWELKLEEMKTNQLTETKKRLENFETNIQWDANFKCEEIGKNCPFIKVINKQHFEKLENEKIKMEEEVKNLETQTSKDFSLHTEWQIIEKKIEELKKQLLDMDFKSREEKEITKNQLQKQIQTLDSQISTLELEIQKLQDYQQQKSAFLSNLEKVKESRSQLLDSKQKLAEESEKIQQELDKPEIKENARKINYFEDFMQIIHDLENLIQDFTETKIKIKQLEKKETMLKNLYNILSKELLFVALDEYLPVLSELINNFLTKVVDYQISMQIVENGEKLELEAKIEDEKWEREIKSLSWWQKTILKLVRMLAISSYMRTPLLFLDETINNMDVETIAKVSEMIEDFVHQRDMKFYTVTHSTEIQEMKIRDQTIEL